MEDEIDIFTASNIGDMHQVKKLLQKNPNSLNKFNSRNWNALMYACYSGHLDIVNFLLNNGAEATPIDQKSNTSINLLSLASKCSNSHIIKTLLNNVKIKSKINDRCLKTGATSLFLASSFGYHVVVLELLNSGAKTEIISEKTYGRTPLLQACANGHELVVESLLKFNADMGAIDTNGDTAMALAEKRNFHQIVDLLDTYAVRNLNKGFSGLSAGNKNIRKTQSLDTVSIGAGPAEMNRIKPKILKKPERKKVEKQKVLPDLRKTLINNGLEKYFDNFLCKNCDMTIFLTLTEEELKTVYGVKLFGPRRKLSMLIKNLKAQYL